MECVLQAQRILSCFRTSLEQILIHPFSLSSTLAEVWAQHRDREGCMPSHRVRTLGTSEGLYLSHS